MELNKRTFERLKIKLNEKENEYLEKLAQILVDIAVEEIQKETSHSSKTP